MKLRRAAALALLLAFVSAVPRASEAASGRKKPTAHCKHNPKASTCFTVHGSMFYAEVGWEPVGPYLGEGDSYYAGDLPPKFARIFKEHPFSALCADFVVCPVGGVYGESQSEGVCIDAAHNLNVREYDSGMDRDSLDWDSDGFDEWARRCSNNELHPGVFRYLTWSLMVPHWSGAGVDSNAPMRTWEWHDKYHSKAECEAERRKQASISGATGQTGPNDEDHRAQIWSRALCVRSDDPRLEPPSK